MLKLFSLHKLKSDIWLIELSQFHGYDSYYTIDLFKIQFCSAFLPVTVLCFLQFLEPSGLQISLRKTWSNQGLQLTIILVLIINRVIYYYYFFFGWINFGDLKKKKKSLVGRTVVCVIAISEISLSKCLLSKWIEVVLLTLRVRTWPG